jgi:hypothetical protein
VPGQPVGKAVVLATATMCLRGVLSDPEGLVSEVEPPPPPSSPPLGRGGMTARGTSCRIGSSV